MNTAGLRADFERILRDSISCEITLNGQVTEGLECEGTVEVLVASFHRGRDLATLLDALLAEQG